MLQLETLYYTMHAVLVSLALWPLSVPAYQILQADQSTRQVGAGGSLRLTCSSDTYFEYCSWSHQPGDRECHLEWKYLKVSEFLEWVFSFKSFNCIQNVSLSQLLTLLVNKLLL